jgi:hypothetical protein
MNELTKQKLRKLANLMLQKWGLESIEFTNFLQLSHEVSENAGLVIAPKTIKRHENYFKSLMKYIQQNEMSKKEEVIEVGEKPSAKIEVQVNESGDKISKIIVQYASGKEDEFILKEKEVEVEPQRPISLGLFDYIDNKTIIINRGRYKGKCNVRNVDEILKIFGNWEWFLKWTERKLEEATAGKVSTNPDTPRDIEILKNLIIATKRTMNKTFI